MGQPCESPDFAERSPVPPMVPRVDAPILVHCFGRIEGRKRPLATSDKTYELQTGLLTVDKLSIGMGQDLAQMGCVGWPKVS